ncbi:hypothetical protein SAMN05192549_108177 [Duganella sacchari]|uniref:Uncharacterized protein n=1 Tax=Duganella sacchari TaxID=551987 RepID=A0A1M7QWR6_9BURK|nr:hypothetical protein [Duganella sacchari]SHN36457.1 hypothetical protein SAMN05192549_108177 [Duganella sacchari]
MQGRRSVIGGFSGVMRGSMAGSGTWYVNGVMMMGGIVGGADGGPFGPPPERRRALHWRLVRLHTEGIGCPSLIASQAMFKPSMCK